jgi:signal transduction histidine kinase
MPSVPRIAERHPTGVSNGNIIGEKLSRQNGKMHALFGQEPSLPQLVVITRSLAAELGRVREKERQKIADDLHDQIGQNLVVAKMKLDALKSSLGEEYSTLVAGISDLINHTIKDTRSLIQELHPEWLSELSLREAISWLTEQIEARYGLRCVIEFAPLPKPLKKDVQEVIFQAVRELLVNVAKHARASKVRIICQCERSWIRIRIVDDGRGFDPSAILSPSRKSEGFGLMIVRARLGLVGASLYINSHPGGGTSATITLPMNVN